MFTLTVTVLGCSATTVNAARKASSAERLAIRAEIRAGGKHFARARVRNVVVSTVGRYARASVYGPRVQGTTALFRGAGRRWRFVDALESNSYPCGIGEAVITDLQLRRFQTRCSAEPERLDPSEVRFDLLAARLMPAPAFPTALPTRLRRSSATVKLSAPDYLITWDRGFVRGDVPRGYVSLSRSPFADFDTTLETVRSRGGPERAERIGSRSVLYVCGHVCGFIWREGAFTYDVFADYPQSRGDADEQDARAIIFALQPLS